VVDWFQHLLIDFEDIDKVKTLILKKLLCRIYARNKEIKKRMMDKVYIYVTVHRNRFLIK